MQFAYAVRNTDELKQAFRPGLQALSDTDQKRIACRDTRKLAGSVNL